MATTNAGPLSIEQLEIVLGDPNTPLRPIITNLNGDNAWLLSCPRPAAEADATGRAFYHIVLDPWLTQDGGALLYSWILHLKRSTEPGTSNASALGALADRIEGFAAKRGSNGGARHDQDERNPVDAIFISSDPGDHCNQETLLGFPKSVPVFARSGAAQKMKAWNHFDTIVTTKSFDPATQSWTSAHPGAALPAWLSVIGLDGHTPAHFGLVIVVSSQEEDAPLHELIVFAPHGVLPTQSQLQYFSTDKVSPPVKTLALLHSMKESWMLGQKISLGASNALAIARQSHASYYVKTADLVLDLSGMLSYAQSEQYPTFKTALEADPGKEGDHVPAFFEVDDGKCLVLAA